MNDLIWDNKKKFNTKLDKIPTAEILSGKNARAFLVCGFFNEIIQLRYPENMKQIMGAVLVKMGWIGCAIYHATSKRLPEFFFSVLIF